MAKTEVMILGPRQRSNAQCDEIDIEIDGGVIRRVGPSAKSLGGITINDRLS